MFASASLRWVKVKRVIHFFSHWKHWCTYFIANTLHSFHIPICLFLKILPKFQRLIWLELVRFIPFIFTHTISSYTIVHDYWDTLFISGKTSEERTYTILCQYIIWRLSIMSCFVDILSANYSWGWFWSLSV